MIFWEKYIIHNLKVSHKTEIRKNINRNKKQPLQKFLTLRGFFLWQPRIFYNCNILTNLKCSLAFDNICFQKLSIFFSYDKHALLAYSKNLNLVSKSTVKICIFFFTKLQLYLCCHNSEITLTIHNQCLIGKNV